MTAWIPEITDTSCSTLLPPYNNNRNNNNQRPAQQQQRPAQQQNNNENYVAPERKPAIEREKAYEFDDILTGTGVLEIMQDGYGFLRSSDYNKFFSFYLKRFLLSI